jgi:hypothetical protein
MGVGVFGRAWCEASKGQVQSPKKEGASHFIPCPKQFLQSNGQDLVSFFFFFEKFMEKTNGLSTMFGFLFLSNPNFL